MASNDNVSMQLLLMFRCYGTNLYLWQLHNDVILTCYYFHIIASYCENHCLSVKRASFLMHVMSLFLAVHYYRTHITIIHTYERDIKYGLANETIVQKKKSAS